MTKRFAAILASLSLSACTPGVAWLTAQSPHDRAAWVMAGGSSDAAASDAGVTTSASLRIDGKELRLSKPVPTRFDIVGHGNDRTFRAIYEMTEPDEAEGYQVTVTLVSLKPWDHADLAATDLVYAAFQVHRSGSGGQVSRQAVFTGNQLAAVSFRVDGRHVDVRLEQRSVLADFNLSTVVAIQGLSRV